MSLSVANDIRNKFVNITEELSENIRELFGEGSQAINFKIDKVEEINWVKLKGEISYFIDGGLAQFDILNQTPLIIRSGIFKIISGETLMDQRENYEIFPLLIGDFYSESQEHPDYIGSLRILAEILSVYRILLEIEPDSQKKYYVLLHGPLSYTLRFYNTIKYPETTIEKFDKLIPENLPEHIKNEFKDIVKNFRQHCEKSNCFNNEEDSICSLSANNKEIPFPCFFYYILKKIYGIAKENKNILLTGVVERSKTVEFLKNSILPEILSKNDSIFDKFKIDKTEDIDRNIDIILKKTQYKDPLILSIILKDREYCNFLTSLDKFKGLGKGLELLTQVLKEEVGIKFTYLKVKENSYPIRIEIPDFYSKDQENDLVSRIYKYSTLLPNYCFPIGLDIVDKYAKIPKWISSGFEKLIKVFISDDPSIKDDVMRKLVTQVLLSKRDFFYRPEV